MVLRDLEARQGHPWEMRFEQHSMSPLYEPFGLPSAATFRLPGRAVADWLRAGMTKGYVITLREHKIHQVWKVKGSIEL